MEENEPIAQLDAIESEIKRRLEVANGMTQGEWSADGGTVMCDGPGDNVTVTWVGWTGKHRGNATGIGLAVNSWRPSLEADLERVGKYRPWIENVKLLDEGPDVLLVHKIVARHDFALEEINRLAKEYGAGSEVQQ